MRSEQSVRLLPRRCTPKFIHSGMHGWMDRKEDRLGRDRRETGERGEQESSERSQIEPRNNAVSRRVFHPWPFCFMPISIILARSEKLRAAELHFAPSDPLATQEIAHNPTCTAPKVLVHWICALSSNSFSGVFSLLLHHKHQTPSLFYTSANFYPEGCVTKKRNSKICFLAFRMREGGASPSCKLAPQPRSSS